MQSCLTVDGLIGTLCPNSKMNQTSAFFRTVKTQKIIKQYTVQSIISNRLNWRLYWVFLQPQQSKSMMLISGSREAVKDCIGI